MSNVQAIFERQSELVTKIQQIGTNFSKDSAHRRTSEYLKLRLESLDNLWGEFELNHARLETLGTKDQRYFQEAIFERTKQYYTDLRAKIATYEPFKLEQPSGSRPEEKDSNKIDELLSRQRTNFRAFQRMTASIQLSEINEKWELDDELSNLQSIWKNIDKLHLDIDNILGGEDEVYLNEFLKYESEFKRIKRGLNQKLAATSHLQHATPLLEIPVFTGRYNFWPTFFDLFSESIHNNKFLSKAQKMQHLKGKLKGEPERLIQHLNISAENYDIAWEILTHRYNNTQLLFTNQIEIFLNQPHISKPTSHDIKRLYDTSTECIHAIHNLGVDTTTWDPILVHLITKKMDNETLVDYKEARKSPRELASLDELMQFLESKYIALEPSTQRWEKTHSFNPPKQGFNSSKPNLRNPFINNRAPFRGFQAAHTSSTRRCPLCQLEHELYKCNRFVNMSVESKIRTISQLQLCKNCLFKHSTNKCTSIKKCKYCNNAHHTSVHDCFSGSPVQSSSFTIEQPRAPAIASTSSNRAVNNKSFASNNVCAADEEVLWATVLLNVKAIDGSYITLRCLLDQGSQLTLISENAAQRLGLHRRRFSASLAGVGATPKHSKSIVILECQSIYGDYSFTTEAAVIPRLVTDLPHVSFLKQSWPHIQHMRLADPEYNISKPIDLLLDASVYSEIIMSGLVKGPQNTPIAQQTKLGWILSGTVKTFSCNVVINDLEEIAQYWEMEEIPSTASELSEADKYCEEYYQATTRRLENGRYEVALPMKRNYEELLGSSKGKAIAQFKHLESKLIRDKSYSESYVKFMNEFLQLNHMRLAGPSETPKCFLPHHGVVKADSTTTKLRVVFNASSKTSSGLSLNDLMECGANLQQDLPSEQIDKPFDFKHPESRKTLGLRWIPTTDSFVFSYDIGTSNQCNSKRQLLSAISKIFDPLGWLSPLTVRAKLLFQKTWASNIGWDDTIPSDIQTEWIQLQQDLSNISKFVIPRYLGNINEKYQLHGFCDASEKAYACAVYLVARDNKGEYTARLVTARTKLCPMKKKVSLARLELCGALLLAQLIKSFKTSFDITNIFAWTDSTIVLGWLQGDINRWKQFVANRVQLIKEILPVDRWNHVKSEDNAADCATRGATVAKLQTSSIWWNGPEWLKNFEENKIKKQTYNAPTLEAKPASINVALETSSNFIDNLLTNNSSITRAVNILGWVLRFKATLRQAARNYDTYLSAEEIRNAYKYIIKQVQGTELSSDILDIKNKGHVRPNSKLVSLHPYLDEEGILRVGGRLSYANISSMSKHPIILSSHGRFTNLIIEQAHITTLHGGPRLTLSYIREKYWIISGMRTVKRQLRLCVKCRRFSNDKQQQIMADLPRARVTPSRPFSNTACDFTGYFDLKLNKGRGVTTYKGYVAVFICLATKAVHLELVTDLSTPAFLAAFRRFCARRGTPRRMYSDNGTNFVGAKRALDKEYREIVRTINQDFFNNLSEFNIDWSFNCPSWASAGGIWEAAVKSFKRHLKRVLGEQKLTYEEFTTLLHQIEACLNSRPLYPLTENPEDSYLTPGHFLIGDSLLSRPQMDPDHLSLPTRWQLVQNMNKQFWKLWSADYLQHLQERTKWKQPAKNLEINDIVLIKEDNLPPGKWALGRIQELHPGMDGYVRVVSLRAKGGIVKRPITKLLLLPIATEENSISSNNREEIKTTALKPETIELEQPSTSVRSRRQPKILSNFLTIALLLLANFIPPSTQKNVSSSIYSTSLNDGNSLYFDKISNMKYIRDEWKLVVYYNLTNYFQAIEDMDMYIKNLTDIGMSMRCSSPFRRISDQLAHELTEIEHYNQLLLSYNNRRQKRGLINGVGSVANYLFGVLDDNFAQQYVKDIEKISSNENHLQQLIRNQTLVIEAESNIVKRNEEIMNKQFSLIKEHLQETSSETNQLRSDVNHGLYFTSSALAANIILEHLRRTQDSLIKTIIDINHGSFDTHLLSIEQLEEQITFISNQLQGDLKIAIEKENIRDLYKIIKVFTKVHKNYLIIEIRIPVVSEEVYELDKIISVPQNKGTNSLLTVPIYPYIAFNLQRENVVFLTNFDLQQCLHVSEEYLMCSLDKAHYNLDLQQHICNITLIDTEKVTSPCTHEQVPCINRWVKLHRPNVWLYSCCDKCSARIFCPSEVTTKTLTGNGLVNLGQGCTLKSDSFTIYSHNNFLKTLNVQPNFEVPEVSILNTLINSSLPAYEFSTENHEQIYHQIKDEIDNLKQASSPDLTIHDFHQYAVSYASLALLLLTLGIVAICILVRRRRRRRRPVAAALPATSRAGTSTRNENFGVHELTSENRVLIVVAIVGII